MALLVVVDASVLIGFLDPGDAHHAAASAAVAQYGAEEILLPASVYAEVLTGAYRRGRAAVRKVEGLVEELPMRVEPITSEIARRAAMVRARAQSLKLADALVLATGDVLEADVVLTADRSWTKVSRRARPI